MIVYISLTEQDKCEPYPQVSIFSSIAKRERSSRFQVAVIMFRPPSYSDTSSSPSSLTLSDSEPVAELITGLQLGREDDEISRHLYANAFEYLRPFLHPFTIDESWLFYGIHKEGSLDVHLTYATNILEPTYHILDVQLLYPDGTKKTQMELHEIIRSTWAKDIESTEIELKFIGLHHIQDVAARKALSNEFALAISQGMDPMSTQLTISGNGGLPIYWRDNPFLMYQMRRHIV